MKPHPKLRKTIKWSGAVVTVLLLLAWVASARLHMYWVPSPGAVRVCATEGRFELVAYDNSRIGEVPTFDCTSINSNTLFSRWYFQCFSRDGETRAGIPIWLLALAMGIPTFAIWRRDTLARRRARLNLCPKCHYDRTGLAIVAKCPECGTPANA